MSGRPVDAKTLDANLDRILTLMQQASTARATVNDATIGPLQSLQAVHIWSDAVGGDARSHGQARRCTARASQGRARHAGRHRHAGALATRALHDEVHAILAARDAAVAAAESAERTREEAVQRIERRAPLASSPQDAARAADAAAAATARAEAAELRAEQAERSFVEAERERAKAVEELAEASASKDASSARLAAIEAQLSREREVLAKVMAENILFVKKLEFAESERKKAQEEKEAMRLEWRQQTEGWFHEAAGQLQTKLLADWGAADALQNEVASLRQDRAKAETDHAARMEELSQSESGLRAEAQSLAVEGRAAREERDELREKLESTRAQLKAAAGGSAAHRAGRGAAAALEETKASEGDEARAGEGEEQLAMQAARQKEAAEVASLRAALEAAEAKASLAARVNERVRAEAAEEHGSLLEALARLDALQEQYDMLSRQNSVLVQTAQAAVGA